MRPYVVAAPTFDPLSGGCVVIHRFAQELKDKGMEVHLVESSDPSWTYPGAPQIDDSIGVYPEITWGNPLGTKTVVRYLLNNVGKIRGPTEYPSSDILFVFSKMFDDFDLPDDRVLFLPVLNTETFDDAKLERNKVSFYVGKGSRSSFIEETANAVEIIRETSRNPLTLRDILQTSKVLYCYDNITGMTEISRLCGCPVIIVPNGEYTKEQYNKHEMGWNGLGWGEFPENFNSSEFRSHYLSMKEVFREKLDRFIEITQNAI